MVVHCRTCGGEALWFCESCYDSHPSCYDVLGFRAWFCESCYHTHNCQLQPGGTSAPHPPPHPAWGSCRNCGNEARVYCLACRGWFCSLEGQGPGCHRHDGSVWFPWCPSYSQRLGTVSSQLRSLDRHWNGGTHIALPPLEHLRVMAQEVDWARSVLGAAISQAESAPMPSAPQPTAVEPAAEPVPEPMPPYDPYESSTDRGDDDSPISVSDDSRF